MRDVSSACDFHRVTARENAPSMTSIHRAGFQIKNSMKRLILLAKTGL
jgi:hypothetical protein